MCWQGNFNPKIAEKDISVFKIVRKISPFKVASVYEKFPYHLDTLYILNTVNNEIVSCPELCGTYDDKVTEAFHSYLSDSVSVFKYSYILYITPNKVVDIKSPLDYFYISDESLVRIECIVPKGSQYCINELGEVVSNKIILKNEMSDLWETVRNK